MDPDELFKRFFGPSPFFPESRYRGYGHSNDDGDVWSHGDHHRNDIFGSWHEELHKQMEEMDRQMRDVFKIFRIADIPSFPALPEGSQDQASKQNPRDFMLKDGRPNTFISPPPSDELETPVTIVPAPHQDDLSSMFDRFFNIPRWNRVRPQDKKDSDLDGEVPSSSEIAELYKGGGETRRPLKESPSPFSFFSHNSVSIHTVFGADGKMEERRTVRDSDGREETTITRRMGDSSHSVTTFKDDSGQVEKRETFHNVDKDNLSDFEHHWQGKKPIPEPGQDNNGSVKDKSGLLPSQPQNPLSNDTGSIFRRLFGFSSK